MRLWGWRIGVSLIFFLWQKKKLSQNEGFFSK